MSTRLTETKPRTLKKALQNPLGSTARQTVEIGGLKPSFIGDTEPFDFVSVRHVRQRIVGVGHHLRNCQTEQAEKTKP